jgi:hypothetical protein
MCIVHIVSTTVVDSSIVFAFSFFEASNHQGAFLSLILSSIQQSICLCSFLWHKLHAPLNSMHHLLHPLRLSLLLELLPLRLLIVYNVDGDFISI